MVDQTPQLLEWSGYRSPTSRHHHGDGCLQDRLGSHLQRNKNWGILVTPGATSSYQLLGTSGGGVCSEIIHEGAVQHSRPSTNGQPDSRCLCQQDGWDPLLGVDASGLPVVAVVSPQRDNTLSRVPAWCPEHCGRRGITISSNLSRVEAQCQCVSVCSENPRSLHSRLVRHPPQSPVAQVCELETRSFCHDDRCLQSQLAGPPRLCLPTICSVGEVYPEDTHGREHCSADSFSLAGSGMVSSPTGVGGGASSPANQVMEPIDRPLRRHSSPDKPREAPVSCVESVRERYTSAGLSQQTADLLVAGWSQGTNTAYESGWRRWTCWCDSSHVDPFSSGIQPFLDFVVGSLFTEGLQYRTVNGIRSAVSMTHNPIENLPIGQHPLVKRLMRGVYNSRPPQPRYSNTWEVSGVLGYLSGLGVNSSLSLKILSEKLALLMALVTASRTSELHALDLWYRVFKPEGVLFKLASLTKKRQVGASPKECFFGAFSEDKHLCVVECLREYERRTLVFRQQDGGSPTQLFLSYVKPHKPVTSQRIAHWIKDMLKLAGVDTNVFSAHSVWGASSSAALSKGVHIADILTMANWSRDSTFKRFYYRSSRDDQYAQRLLSRS